MKTAYLSPLHEPHCCPRSCTLIAHSASHSLPPPLYLQRPLQHASSLQHAPSLAWDLHTSPEFLMQLPPGSPASLSRSSSLDGELPPASLCVSSLPARCIVFRGCAAYLGWLSMPGQVAPAVSQQSHMSKTL